MADVLEKLERAASTSAMRSREDHIRSYALEQRDAAAKAADDLLARSKGKPAPADRSKIAAALEESESWAQRAEDYRERMARRATSSRIVREPLTYDHRANPGNSWFRDLWLTRRGNDAKAKDRLDRHAREMQVELEARAKPPAERRDRGEVIEPDTIFEARGTTPAGEASHFNPPLWLIDFAAVMARPERVLADLVTTFPLPRGVSGVHVPRVITGTQTAGHMPGTPAASRDITDATVSSPVVPITGILDIPQALFDMSNASGSLFDLVFWRDLLNDYDAQLELLLTDGLGAAQNELLGITNIEGIQKVAYTSGTPTAIAAYGHLGEAFGAVSNTRKIRPEAWLMRGGRWAWLTTGEDSQGRPLGCPDAHNPAPVTPDGVPDPVGALIGIPAFTTESIPTNLGTGANQDVVIAVRPKDMLLWESEATFAAFEEPLSGSLEVRLVLRKSAAFIGGRWPSGICTVGGTGMVVPANQ